ncbi:MAG: hypothetical protein IJB93_01010, partial [Clostridia bacterium]|nr:hypothetical protein [Clostridia bacterium]
DPDYSAVEDKIDEAKGNDNLNKDTQDKIKEIEDALAAIKGKTEPEANAKDDQPAVDALEDQLDTILDSIANGTATAPDYTKWDAAEGEYTGLDKTDVKDDILKEAEELKKVIDALKDDPTANATEDQKTITDAADRLNDIIDGIKDGSLKDPDYSAVEDKIDEAKDNDNLNKDTQDKIEAIENALEEIKNKEPEANAKDDQDDVKALEDQLDEILKDIENGTAIKPDYSEAEKAIQDAENIDGISDADKAIVDELKKQLEDIKNNPESNKTEHQDDVDDIKDAALELVEKYESMCFHEGTEKKYTTNVADDKKQSTHTVQCLRCGEVIGTENCSFRTEIVAATCRSEGYTIYTCEGCKLSFKDDFTDPVAHNYSEWRVKEGSCKTANTKTRYCLNPGCMAEQTETVIGEDGKPVYGAHTFVIVKGSEATCLNDGYTDYSRCIVCNEVTESKVIPAKGHVDNNHNGNCDECSQLINPSGHCSCFCHGDSFFEKLLFRFVNFFWKLFKINPICGCGTKHW